MYSSISTIRNNPNGGNDWHNTRRFSLSLKGASLSKLNILARFFKTPHEVVPASGNLRVLSHFICPCSADSTFSTRQRSSLVSPVELPLLYMMDTMLASLYSDFAFAVNISSVCIISFPVVLRTSGVLPLPSCSREHATVGLCITRESHHFGKITPASSS